MSRDPIQERGGYNLYAVTRNNAVGYIDPTGLACSKIGPDVLASVTADAATYVGIGGHVWITLSGMIWDCCCDGQIVYGDAYELTAEAGVSIGLGFGAHTTIPLVGLIGFTIYGPQFSKTTSVTWEKECGKSSSSLSWTIVDISGDIGGGFDIGSTFGASAAYWAKYGINFTLTGGGRSATVSGKVGWKGGGEWEIVTPLVNINGTFGEFDYQWDPNVTVSL